MCRYLKFYVIIAWVCNTSRQVIHTQIYFDQPLCYTSARPEVRGTADVGWRSLIPLPFNPPCTHSRLYHHICLRTDRQWRTWMDSTDAGCAPFLAVWGEGSAVCLGPRLASQRSPYTNYLRLGWWSTNRPLPMNDVSGCGMFNRGRAY